MARSAFVIAAAVFGMCGVSRAQEPERIIVFRHHPGMLEPGANMDARDRDAAAIVKALKASGIGFGAEGGLGRRGYAYQISRDDLGMWNQIVDELLKSGKLRYYRRGLDRFGLGIYPVPPPPRTGPTS